VNHEGQYRIVIEENDRVVTDKTISDPFITTTLIPKGLGAAFLVLFGKLKLVVNVRGSIGAHRVVFGGEYFVDSTAKSKPIEGLTDSDNEKLNRAFKNAEPLKP
jgi:hypothetical protein